MAATRAPFSAKTLSLPAAVIGAAVLLVAVIWGVLFSELERDRAAIIRNTEISATNLSRAFEEHVFQAANRVDQLLKHFRYEYEHDPEGFTERAVRLKEKLYPDLGFQLGMIDADGMLRMSSFKPAAERIDLSDREHYRVHRDNPTTDTLFISKPVLGRVTNKWSIQFTRPMRKPDGSFDGVLVLSIAPEYFSDFYQSIDVGKQGAIALVGMDRVIRARASYTGDPANALGKELPAERPFFDRSKPQGGVYDAPGLVDGVHRIAAYRRLADLPLAVLVLVSRDEAMTAYNESRRTALLLTSAVSIALLAAGGLVALMAYRRAQGRALLEETQLRLVDAQRIAALGNWEWDIVTGDAWLSDEAYHMLGLPDGTAPSLDSFTKAVHPADRPLVQAALDRALAENTPYSVDHRVLRPDGSQIVVHERGEVLRAADGTPLRMHGTVQDVTADRRREAELRKLWRAIEVVPASVIITNRDGVIEFANSAQQRSSGYTADELLGQTPRLFKSGAHDRHFYDEMWQAIAAGREWRGDVKNRCKDGHLVWEDVVISPVFGPSGDVVNFVAVKMDITEKHQRREQAEALANQDALTGLPNRRMFQKHADFTETVVRRDGSSLALLYLDLDGFKAVNDSLGHQAGDLLLRLVAERLNQCARDGDMVARIGGDEFAVSLSLTGDARQEAAAVADRILRVMAQPFDIDGHIVHIGASIGIALYPSSAADMQECLRLADQAMYAAKHQGKNCRMFCDEIGALDKV